MNKTTPELLNDTQRELQELRERLRKSTESMQSSTQKMDVNQAMSGVIKVLGTFEKQ
ncbi:hypothetical protein [Vibrio ponticus]|uniref:hypothetical protein n=1 Tax=Vibrio ponticus TaxID=265668 RepID=UPI00142ECB3E|nr:hypothetical protein [Vibrio ponticus]